MLAHKKPIQILMEESLLAAVDREARRRGSDRSKLIRAAVERWLEEAKRREREERYVRSLQSDPGEPKEAAAWESIQVWPED